MKGVLGSLATQFWSPDLDTPQNKKFVSAFLAKHDAKLGTVQRSVL